MKQYTENQYDDDLTVGTDDYDDSYYTGSVDLFEFSTDDESPISRLKSLILSIDWEITDEVLMQFNEELVALQKIWAGEKINLIYVQALEKISKYIYQKKANSHPSAIKLLLTLYHNLEKIVSSFDLTEEQKKEILLEDVKRFENLKRHIGRQPETEDQPQAAQPDIQMPNIENGSENDLLNLKAIVLGIDWEITDQDLNDLRHEVVLLEKKFADSRPRLILLQGIGTLGAYIKLKKSNAHADAFKILHLFYESLEEIVTKTMTLEEEKAILFPAVERFNSFKALLGKTITPEAIDRDEKESAQHEKTTGSAAIVPAFADLHEEELKGFQAEEEAQALGLESSVDTHVESFFTDNMFPEVEEPIDTDGAAASEELREAVLQGVNVEVDDEEETDEVWSKDAGLAPALSVAEDEEDAFEPAPAFLRDESTADEEGIDVEENFESPAEEPEELSLDLKFPDEDAEGTGLDFGNLDRDLVLQGVDVETEADDDSDEEALPMMEGELAPALAENDETSIYNSETVENFSSFEAEDDEIAGTLEGFFDKEIESHLLKAHDDANDYDTTSSADALDNDEGEAHDSDNSPSLFDSGPSDFVAQDEQSLIEDEDAASSLMEDAFGTEEDAELSETEYEDEDTIAFMSEPEPEESIDSVVDEGDPDKAAEDSLAEDVLGADTDFNHEDEVRQEETDTVVDQNLHQKLDSFFDIDEGVEEPEEDALLFTLPEDGAEDGPTFEEENASPEIDTFQEEEVVFELADEADEQLFSEEAEHGEPEEAAGGNIVSAEGEAAVDQAINAPENDEASELTSVNPVAQDGDAVDEYGALTTCVDSLGVELDDKVILGLWGEIDHLQHNMVEKPLERSFLQLLSTITRHIDQNRYDSSTEAYGLLQSICNALTQLQQDNFHANQELLFTETSKVLTWQEKLLAEQAAKNEAELTFGDPLLEDAEAAQGDFDELLQEYSDDPAFEKYNDEFSGSDDSLQSENIQGDISGGEPTTILAEDLKQEISILRQTLQDEIAELRKELKGNYQLDS
ncbi:MAG: hypothetical protein WBB19_20440 [Desulforhopalus sp.]